MQFKRKKQPKEVVTAIKYDLSNYLSKERELFASILKCMMEENVDLSIRRKNRGGKTESKISKTYNEKILISLIVTKRFFYLGKGRHLSNGELLGIRGLEKDFGNLKQYRNKYSKIDEVPDMYEKAFQDFRRAPGITMQQMAEAIKKDLNKSSLHRYIKAIKFDQYGLCVSVFLHNLKKYKISDNNRGIITQALIEFFKGFRIKEYLQELYSDHTEESLEYQSSFEKVQNSRLMKRDLGKTWDRFYENFYKQMDEKFDGVIKKKA